VSTYRTWAGVAKEPFSPSVQGGGTRDALGDTVFDTAGAAGAALKPLLWTDYQAELAVAAAKKAAYGYVAGGGGYAGQAATLAARGGGGGGYAGRGFVDVVFDAPPPAPPRRDVCTCGGQKFGGGTCSSWCDSSAARSQHSRGTS
jgi:hypothetical protein